MRWPRAKKNLADQLALPLEKRASRISTYDGTHLNPNVYLWKYTGKTFVRPVQEYPQFGRLRVYCWAMPSLSIAACMRLQDWLRDNKIGYIWLTHRQRREHRIWNDEIRNSGEFAPCYEDAPDEVAKGGHK